MNIIPQEIINDAKKLIEKYFLFPTFSVIKCKNVYFLLKIGFSFTFIYATIYT